MKKLLKKILSAVIVSSVLLTGLPAYAAEHTVPDASRTCSLTVTVKDRETQAAVKGVSVALYQVGTVGTDNGNYFFNYGEQAFADAFGASKGGRIPADKVTDSKSAETFFGKTADLDPKYTGEVGDNGSVVFSNVEQGLYLVAQNSISGTNQSFDPFLVSLPFYDDTEGVYLYDVTASPKTEKTTDRYTPVVVDSPSVIKQVIGSGAPAGQTFTFVFHRMDDSYPMMDGSVNGSKSLTFAADGASHGFGKISFTAAGTYVYEIYEDRSAPAENFTYDATVYYVTYHVAASGTKLFIESINIRRNDKENPDINEGKNKADPVVFTNTYTQPGNNNNGGGGGGSEEPPVTPPAANVESVHITGAKIWNDNNNEAGNRPSSITVHLYADGREVASTNVSGDWSFDFGSYPVWQSGNRISYTIAEDGVTGYTASYTTSTSGSSMVFQLTNSSNASVQGASRSEDTSGTGSGDTGSSGTDSGSGMNQSVKGAERLPQTGQLWWPVWLMAGAGSVLILAGLVEKRRAAAVRK